MHVLQAIYEDEPGNRRRLWALRESPEYERPFEEENPLVTVYIPTYSNAEDLARRSIPSVLAQTYDNLEILVIGDAASPAVEAAARSFDDPRLRFLNLGIRGPYPDDPVELWRVAGTAPTNEGLGLAKGQWIALNCDDDAFTPDHVELLLAEARSRRLEYVYGDMRRIDPDREDAVMCTFPPRNEHFGVQAGLLHRGLRIFHHELLVFGNGGDWAWMRRMLRLGVRIGMINDVVVDYYPSNRWGTPDLEPGTLG
jgi:glycosyltransferase involved in cell wall biosynthesis